MRIKLIFILSLISCYILLVSCNSYSEPIGLNGKVQKVISGQTIEVLIEESNLLTKVRLIGIEAPDYQQKPWGLTAKNKLTEWLKGEKIVLELGEPTEDKFGRKLAYVWHDRTLINEKLIAQGYVLDSWEYKNKYSKLYQRAREYARLMGYGIWNSKEPMRQSSGEFRSQN